MAATGWNITNETLKTVPTNFILDKSSIFIHRQDVSEMAQRISCYLKNNSIAAIYHYNIALIEATTTDLVTFTVRLFRGNDRYSHGIIMEVKRTDGDAYIFQRHCHKLFDVVQATDHVDSKILYPLPISETLPIMREGHAAMIPSLVSAYEMVNNNYINVKSLGLKRLMFMSNDKKSNAFTATFASKAILFGISDLDATMTNHVFDIINEMGNFHQTITNAEVHHDQWYELRRLMELGSLSLMVLRNSLLTILNHTRLSLNFKANPWLGEPLISSLLSILKKARLWPQVASISASCLSLIFSLSKNNASLMYRDLKAVSILFAAKEIGKSYYSPLATEANNAIASISQRILKPKLKKKQAISEVNYKRTMTV